MRSADATTIVRVLLIILVAYLIIYKFNPFVIAVLIAIAILLDAVDGFFALHEASKGRITFGKYVSALRGNERARTEVAAVKKTLKKKAKYGARMIPLRYQRDTELGSLLKGREVFRLQEIEGQKQQRERFLYF